MISHIYISAAALHRLEGKEEQVLSVITHVHHAPAATASRPLTPTRTSTTEQQTCKQGNVGLYIRHPSVTLYLTRLLSCRREPAQPSYTGCQPAEPSAPAPASAHTDCHLHLTANIYVQICSISWILSCIYHVCMCHLAFKNAVNLS
jgi:hypothetical protein